MTKSKNILVAPLNWGLGHATRCIPIIIKLQENGFTPILASDGGALELLKKEFPNLKYIKLPSYNIEYAKKGWFLGLKIFFHTPKLLEAVSLERKMIKKIVLENNIKGIISDNRFGVYHRSIPSVYITHQLTVLSGLITVPISKIHQRVIKNFDECWVPDISDTENFSGKLSRLKNHNTTIKYIGMLSRFMKKEVKIIYDYLVLLSGPEPQRSILEQLLFTEFKNTSKNILFIKGKIEETQKITTKGTVTIYNFMTSVELETAINQSNIIIARSGYTTIMDLAKMNKKAFFIPTPGQFEQEYLAKRLKKLKYAPYAKQDDFCIKTLEEVSLYKGFHASTDFEVNFSKLFTVFD